MHRIGGRTYVPGGGWPPWRRAGGSCPRWAKPWRCYPRISYILNSISYDIGVKYNTVCRGARAYQAEGGPHGDQHGVHVRDGRGRGHGIHVYSIYNITYDITYLITIQYVRAYVRTRRSVAPMATSMGFMSEMGEAVAMLPATDATLRICWGVTRGW
jgi:hypothetical protein